MAATSVAPTSAQVLDLVVRRVERALKERVRYRYVKPLVLHEGESYRIQSPCCSRKVDPSGGLIDIALLAPQEGSLWCLCSRDHTNQTWRPQHQDTSLDALLDILCLDSEHQFWV
ncbi:hypothetical protein [Rhodoferax sp.]|uniref:DUF3024 domain-containing protein n=1 Tax=Rhodoferax sp. TaxID=50421 RepID=UPI002634FF3D|nr:hypothetical protein [Rhodoferax sp.]MDD2926762.1 hypothetical protein [Rhodoferax sp.]